MLLNRKRADDFLEEFGIDAIVSSSRENTTYLTNFLAVKYIHDRMYNAMPGSGENFTQIYGIYLKNGKSILVLPASYFMIARTDQTVTKDIFLYGKAISLRDENPQFETRVEADYEKFVNNSSTIFDSAGKALAAVLKEYGAGRKAGVDLSDMHASSLSELKNSRIGVANATELFRFIRMVKSQEELSRLKIAAGINERAMDEIFKKAKPGASEKDLARAYSMSIVSEDASVDSVMCPSGTKGGTMISPTDSKLYPGSLIWVDVACRYEGYCADTGDSASLGKPPEKQNRYYSNLEKIIERAEKIVTPGMKPSELNSDIAKLWDKLGQERSPTGMGHGIGLEVHEYPRISAAKGPSISSSIKDEFIESSIDIPFEEGMLLNFEAPYLVRGWGGVHLERTLVLGKRKCRPLIDQERHLRIL